MNNTTIEGWEDAVNRFIKKWCSVANIPHLLDSDENEGQELRALLSTILSTLVKEMEGLKVSPPYPNASNGYSREVSDTEKEFNAGISAAVEVVKKMK